VSFPRRLDVFFLDPGLLPVEEEVAIEEASCAKIARGIAILKGLDEERQEAVHFAVSRLLVVLATTMTRAQALQRIRKTFLPNFEEATT